MRPDDLRLPPTHRRAADAVLDREAATRRHLVAALSGAHAYGFPSADSDVDVKCVHVAPTSALVGLSSPRPSAERIEVVDGIEIDYGSNEIGQVIRGITKGDGNLTERVLSGWTLRASPELASLAPLAHRALSRRLHAHYRGFARSQMPSPGDPLRAKGVLYVLRTALTGTHALLTGEIVVDLTELLGHLPAELRPRVLELIDVKRAGERIELEGRERDAWMSAMAGATTRLDEAAEHALLPDDCENVAELEEWLLELRRAWW